ncbi:hypothetical protein ACFWIW_10785 [Amycolatopsis sp. NPDC058340]|uniref:hypothetical protein n=1 Tax=Amycolatopsis sp. NPDC058340 TaxID=3346453 RepID=UPI00364EA444
MPDLDERQTYYITAKEFPVAIGLRDVTYHEALRIARNCVARGEILHGPDDDTEGYVIAFDRVAGVRVTVKVPSGPAMAMPPEVVKELAVEPEDGGDDEDRRAYLDKLFDELIEEYHEHKERRKS